MKKIISLLILFVIIFSVSGCVTFHNKFNRAENIEDISYIEVYFVNYAEQEPNIPETASPIFVIDKQYHEEIIITLESFDFRNTLIIIAANDPVWNICGFILKIVYNSGTYQVISRGGFFKTFFANGDYKSDYGQVTQNVWDQFIIKYIGEEMFNKYELSW